MQRPSSRLLHQALRLLYSESACMQFRFLKNTRTNFFLCLNIIQAPENFTRNMYFPTFVTGHEGARGKAGRMAK